MYNREPGYCVTRCVPGKANEVAFRLQGLEMIAAAADGRGIAGDADSIG